MAFTIISLIINLTDVSSFTGQITYILEYSVRRSVR
jgi:hypothetical protein